MKPEDATDTHRASTMRALFLYTALALVSLYPQSTRPHDTLAQGGDALEASWTLAWNVHQLFSKPFQLFDANILYPNPKPLAFTDHRLLLAVLVAPVLWATSNPVLAFNAALLVGLLFDAMSLRFLALKLGIDRIGAWAAGALYAFHTYQIVESAHLHIVVHGFLPLVVWQVLCLLETGRPRHAWGAATLMLLQGLCSSYHLLYGSLLVALLMLAGVAVRPAKALRAAPHLLLAGLLAALLISPLSIPLMEASRFHGFVRGLSEGVELDHYVLPTGGNVLYGSLSNPGKARQAHFIGFVSLALALLALATWSQSERTASPRFVLPPRAWIAAAAFFGVVFILLSLGRDLVAFDVNWGPGPYRILYQWMPGFRLVRNPERLGVVAMLFVSLLTGRGVSLIATKARPLASALAILVPLEHVSSLPRWQRVPVGDEVPQVYRWLAANPVRALAEVPVHGEGLLRKDAYEMYFSTYHFAPIVQGYESYQPLLTKELRRLASEFPSERSIAALSYVGVDTIVVHHGRPGSEDLGPKLLQAERNGRIARVARFAGVQAKVFEGDADEVYRIVSSPRVRTASFPRGVRAGSPAWRYRASAGRPELAGDKDRSTLWKIDGPLQGREFIQLSFDEALTVSGVVIQLRMDSTFPSRFRIEGKTKEGRWRPLARYDAAQSIQLLDQLMTAPSRAAIGFSLDPAPLLGLRVVTAGPKGGFFGWSIPEIEVLVPAATPEESRLVRIDAFSR